MKKVTKNNKRKYFEILTKWGEMPDRFNEKELSDILDKDVKLVTLTDHAIKVLARRVKAIPSDVRVKVIYDRQLVEIINSSNVLIPIIKEVPIRIDGLPEPKDGVYYVGGKRIIAALKELDIDRPDILSVSALVYGKDVEKTATVLIRV